VFGIDEAVDAANGRFTGNAGHAVGADVFHFAECRRNVVHDAHGVGLEDTVAVLVEDRDGDGFRQTEQVGGLLIGQQRWMLFGYKGVHRGVFHQFGQSAGGQCNQRKAENHHQPRPGGYHREGP